SHARVCLSPIRIQRSTARSSPEKAPTSLGPSGLSTDPVTGIAVLEYGLTEILPPVGALSKHAERLCRPGRQASRAHPRGKPGFWTFESGCGRETDFPLEGDGFEPSVPRRRPSPSWPL